MTSLFIRRKLQGHSEILEILFRYLQFAKSQEFPNVRALQIFERRVLFSVLNSRTIFEHHLCSSDSVAKFATQNSSVSETVLIRGFPEHLKKVAIILLLSL